MQTKQPLSAGGIAITSDIFCLKRGSNSRRALLSFLMCFLNCSQALKHMYDLILHFFSSSCKKACNVRNCKFCIARWLLACLQLIEFAFTAKRSTHEMHFSVLHSLPFFQVRKLGTLKLEVIRKK